MALRCEPDRRYVSLDDKTYLDLARQDPQGFVDGLPERVAIDEVQRAPELALAIKRSVDANRKPGRFLLTGSVICSSPLSSNNSPPWLTACHAHPGSSTIGTGTRRKWTS